MARYAVLAEQERDFISLRTKTSMAVAKEKYGTKYGGTRPEAEVRHKAVKKLADEQARKVQDIIETYRKEKKVYRIYK